jgi:hypothetical protein
MNTSVKMLAPLALPSEPVVAHADSVTYCAFEESPCDACPIVRRCRESRLACGQFRSFVSYGGRRWRSHAREPSAAIYSKVFRETPEQLAA